MNVPGVPDVSGLAADLIRDEAGRPYMTRHYLSADRCLRFHHLHLSDDDRALHDHPWDFVSVILAGGYRELTPTGAQDYRAPALVTHAAEDLHRLELEDGGDVWTLVLTGRPRRRWGFALPDGSWVDARRVPWTGSTEALEPARPGVRLDRTPAGRGATAW